MRQIFIILLFIFSLILCFSFNYGFHTQIVNYWFTTEECGIGRESHLMDGYCFGERTRQQLAKIQMGRPSQIGEFPWVVLIYTNMLNLRAYCTGSIVNSHWIITAAHCFNGIDGPFEHKIRLIERNIVNKSRGMEYSVQYVFNYPLWKITGAGWGDMHYDMALIRIKDPIDLKLKPKTNRHFRDINSICFPQKYSFNTQLEYAMIMGTGTVEPQKDAHRGGYRVWTGWTIIEKIGQGQFDHQDDSGLVIRARHNIIGKDNKSSTCSGDSGSPLVQYINGRAVIIGVLAGTIYDSAKDRELRKTTGCGKNGFMIFTRVSFYIDWINEIITKGEQWARNGLIQHISNLNTTKM